MNHFKKITNIPAFDIESTIAHLFDSGEIEWDEHNQICLTSVPGKEDNIYFGKNSLQYDWEASYTDQNGNLIVPERNTIYDETDFTEICTPFRGTPIEDLINHLRTKYVLGRIRLMRSWPKTCLSWHTDTTCRLHYPIDTQEGCLMIIEDEVKHLEKGKWWFTNTVLPHTAINASKQPRVHLVIAIVDTF